MRRPPRTLLPLGLVVVAACDGPGPFDELRIYAHDLVEAQTGTPALTIEACAAAQPDPTFFANCWQTLVLCPSGAATMLLTDIVEDGVYTVDGRDLEVRRGRDGDVPPVRFRLSAGLDEAERVETGERWVRWPLTDERAAYNDDCDP